jgi:hypothetical protein
MKESGKQSIIVFGPTVTGKIPRSMAIMLPVGKLVRLTRRDGVVVEFIISGTPNSD